MEKHKGKSSQSLCGLLSFNIMPFLTRKNYDTTYTTQFQSHQPATGPKNPGDPKLTLCPRCWDTGSTRGSPWEPAAAESGDPRGWHHVETFFTSGWFEWMTHGSYFATLSEMVMKLNESCFSASHNRQTSGNQFKKVLLGEPHRFRLGFQLFIYGGVQKCQSSLLIRRT